MNNTAENKTDSYCKKSTYEEFSAFNRPISDSSFLCNPVEWKDLIKHTWEHSHRYSKDNIEIILKNYKAPNYPYYFSNVNTDGVAVIPNKISLVDNEESLCFKWKVNYKFGSSPCPTSIFPTDKTLFEDRYTTLYSRKENLGVHCSQVGDRYPVKALPTFVKDTTGNIIDNILSCWKYSALFGKNVENAGHSFYELIKGIAGSYLYGENHVSYFFSMLRYLYSALTNELTGGTISGEFNILSDMYKSISSINDARDVSNDFDKSFVSNSFDDNEYMHFLITCAQSGTTKYYSTVNKNPEMKNVYDRMNIDFKKQIVVLDYPCKFDPKVKVNWAGNPIKILIFINMYARSLSLYDQLNDAICIMRTCAHLIDVKKDKSFSMPVSCHISDIIAPVIMSIDDFNLTSLIDIRSTFIPVMSDFFLSSLIITALNGFRESICSVQENTLVGEMKFDIDMTKFIDYTILRKKKILDLLGFTVGLDLSPLRQTSLDIILCDLLYSLPFEKKEKTACCLEMLCIPNPTCNSWAHFLRRKTLYRSNREVIQLFKTLNFSKDIYELYPSNISNEPISLNQSFKLMPKCEYIYRNFEPSGFDRQMKLFQEARMFLINIDFDVSETEKLEKKFRSLWMI